MTSADIPSRIDLRLMGDAREWERTAMQRPFRVEFFEAFTAQLQKLALPKIRIIDLGSGPGFLALHLLSRMPNSEIALLDFSPAMHDLARHRLCADIDRVDFIECDFKEPGWEANLGKFDAVVTNQAVHELRHKRYAETFHRQVKTLLGDGGIYLVCDHFSGDEGMENDQLFMSLDEQRSSLVTAGYKVTDILVKGGRALYRATLRTDD